jgi:hypothetical protein
LSTIAEMMVKIGALDDGFNKTMDDVKSKTDTMGESVGKVGAGMTKWVTGPIVVVGVGMLALASKTGDYADSVLDLSA